MRDATLVYSTSGLDLYSTAPRTSIERLAALALRTTYREPVGGRSTTPGSTSHDLLRALSAVEDQLGAEMALSMACSWAGNWPKVARMASAELRDPRSELCGCVHRIQRQRRLRLVVYDAFHALALGTPPPLATAARAIGVRKSDYTAMFAAVRDNLARRASIAATWAIQQPEPVFSAWDSIRGG